MAVNGVVDNCRFVVGPIKSDQKPVSLFIYNENDHIERFKMVVFSAKNILCCLMLGWSLLESFENSSIISVIVSDNIESEELYSELHSPLTTQLVAMSSEIDQFIRKGSVPSTTPSGTLSPKPVDVSSPKFLYLNECNLRHEGNLTGKNGAVSRDIINILMDLYEEKDPRNVAEETIVKTMNDYWIVRKNSNSRCFFVLINKYATLIDISGKWCTCWLC